MITTSLIERLQPEQRKLVPTYVKMSRAILAVQALDRRPHPLKLFDREQSILTMLSKGVSQKNVGKRAYYAPSTVRVCLRNAQAKAGAVTGTTAEVVNLLFRSTTLTRPSRAEDSVRRRKLSPRQSDELYMVALGMTAAESAAVWCVSEPTVKTLRAELYDKTKALNAPHAVRRAYQFELMPEAVSGRVLERLPTTPLELSRLRC